MLEIGENDKKGVIVDFLQKSLGTAYSVATGSGLSDLLSLGVEVSQSVIGLARDKYQQSWIFKVIAMDTTPQDQAQLQRIVDQIYREDADFKPTFAEKEWHVVHAGISAIFHALKGKMKISGML